MYVNKLFDEGARAREAYGMKADFFESTVCDAAAGEHFRSLAADDSFWAFSQRDPRRGLDPPAAQRISEIHARR